MHLLRIASPGREATSGAIGITVLNLGIATGATLGGAVLDNRQAGALPAVAAVVIAIAPLGLVVNGLRGRGGPVTGKLVITIDDEPAAGRPTPP